MCQRSSTGLGVFFPPSLKLFKTIKTKEKKIKIRDHQCKKSPEDQKEHIRITLILIFKESINPLFFNGKRNLEDVLIVFALSVFGASV